MEMEPKMTLKEADRLGVIKRKERKEITLKKASEELGLSLVQTKRIWKRYKLEGSLGLLSRRRGKASNNQIPEETLIRIVKIIKENYADYGPTLTKEKLEEKHQLVLSKESIRQLMIKEGIWKAKKVKEKKVHARRTRRCRLGELVQIDGSYEYWFEEREEKCCLLVAVDDATSSLMRLQFCRVETTSDYLSFVENYIGEHGRPLAFYSDKHAVFRVNQKQKYEGNFMTRLEEVLKVLDIELICAHSPQAKGRVERANGILQDRLIKELRERGVSGIEEGNKYLEEFRISYNKKFAVEPAHRENAHRRLQEEHKRKYLFMEKEERTLTKELSFQYQRMVYHIETTSRNRLTGKRIEIYARDGEIKAVVREGAELKYRKWEEKRTAPQVIDTKELEVMWRTRKRSTSLKHPWR